MSGHAKEFSFMKNTKRWLAFVLLTAGVTFSLSASEKPVYNSAGEVDESAISSILDASLKDTK